MKALASLRPTAGLMVFVSFLVMTSLETFAQNEVSIGSSTTKSNAILWLNGNGSQGLILPVVTSKTAVSNPDKGMIVYDNTDNKVWYRTGSAWVEVGAGGGTSTSLNIQLSGNQLQLRDGTTLLNSVAIAGGTQANGAFMVFNSGSWQYATLSGDVSGANGALQVDGIKGKTIPALPTNTQVLIYDGTAWKFQALTGGTDSQTLTFTTPNLSISNGNLVNLSALDKDAQTLSVTGSTLSIAGGNSVTLPGSGSVTSISSGTGLTTGSGPITTTGTISIAPGGIGPAELADGSVTANKISSNAVDNSKIVSNANIDISKLNGGGTSNNNKVLKVVGGVVTYANDEIGAAGTGDITDVIAGTGLTGGATAGAATLNVNAGTGAGQIVQLDGTGKLPAIDGSQLINMPAGGSGTVTSVSLVMPAIFAVSGSPVTTNGTLTTTLASQTSATVFAAPAGVAGIPSFRALTATDVPNIDASKITSGTLSITSGGTGSITAAGALTNLGALGSASTAGGDLTGTFTNLQINAGAITNTDISGTAAIAGTKVVPAFGVQNISTTGTLTTGAATVSGLTIGTSVWPTNASGVLTNNGTGTLSWIPTGGTGTVTSVDTGTGLTGGPVTTSGTISVDVGTTAGKIVQLDGTGKLPAIDGSQLINLPAPTVADGSITGGTAGAGVKIAAGTITDANISAVASISATKLASTVVLDTETPNAAGDISGDFSTGLQIKSNTITGTDLATNITISTTGNINVSAPGIISGAGSGITAINATNISSGSLALARITTGNNGDVLTTVSGVPAWQPSAAGATTLDGLTDATVTSPAAGQILVNDGAGQFKNVNLSGDATVNNSGVLTISNGAVSGGTGGEISDLSITDVDISTVATIAGTKVVPDFGTQDILTTGTLTSGSGTTFGTAAMTWPAANASGVLTNNGSGVLTWAPGGGGSSFSTLNTIPKGDGSTLVASQLFDDGTNVGIGTTAPSHKLQIVATTGRAISATNADAVSATIRGENTGGGIGVYGGGSGTGYGGRFIAFDTGGTGILSDGGSTGILARSGGADGVHYGVYGSSEATGAATNYGVYGRGFGGTTNYAGYFEGNVTAAGTVFITGTNTNTPLASVSSMELFTGRSNAGGLLGGQTNADVSFQYGGNGGGYRHFIQTRHNSVANNNQNSFDFYLNNSTTASGSVAPNSGSVIGMSVTASGAGIGTTTVVNKLDVEGGMAVGATYSGASAAPANGLIVQGNVGIGTVASVNKLDVEGGMAVGATYSGASAAPVNGLIVQGNVGIGNAAPNAPLQFASAIANRKLVLYDVNNNDHQFYGFGVLSGEIRYQTQSTLSNHRFYAGTSSTTSALLMTISGGGNVAIAGSLSKGSGTFKIDHPQDPENKYLYHSFVESPDMMNVYNGNIITNEHGEVAVVLPDYFEALNRDFRYQLTVIGTFAQAIVYKKIENNKFVIKTNKPNVEVSWQVTGIRKDPFAEKNPVIPEVEKDPSDKGRYLHPEAYGKPPELKIGIQKNDPLQINH